MDAHRALSTTDEDERIRILREIERTSSKILVAIDVDPYSCASWYGAADASDMRYTPSSYVSHMPSPYIPQMSSLDAAQMPSPFDPQMAAPSSSYILQMILPDTSWPREYDTFFSAHEYERIERVAQSVDDSTASIILEQHD